MSQADSLIVAELIDSALVIRFNRPSQRNSLSIAVLKELDAIVASFIIRPDIHRLIFTGTDDVFASGANIRELTTLTPQLAQEFSQFGQALFQRIADARQLTIAAINGYCIGGAVDLALACRMRIASSSATFAHPGARLGIITGWGGTQRLPRLIGKRRALEFFLTARRIDALEALRIGLIHTIDDRPVQKALSILISG
jgi:enoyl-CoA hydratase